MQGRFPEVWLSNPRTGMMRNLKSAFLKDGKDTGRGRLKSGELEVPHAF